MVESGGPWEMGGSHDYLAGWRLNDPDCPTEDGCDDLFLGGGQYLKSTSAPGWAQGRWEAANDRYCVALPRRPRLCFALREDDDIMVVWIELSVRMHH